MNRPLESVWLSPNEYLEGEKYSQVRHEYVAGSVYAMSGDRAEKFRDYRCLEALEEYVLVAQDTRRIEVYRRSTGWQLELFTESGDLQFDSVGITLSIDTVYEDVDLPGEESSTLSFASSRKSSTNSSASS